MSNAFVYEEAVKELEEIVDKLSSGKCSLDESVDLYTRGIELSKKCKDRLTEIEQKIAIINSDGKEEIFDADEDDSL